VLLFIDLETTGLESEDKICSVAIIAIEKEEIIYKYEFINEGKKITTNASSIHHITKEMIKDKPTFQESEIYEFLKQNNSEENTLIAHNIKFNLEKLSSAGLFWRGDIIDTLRVTKHLIPECEFFSLQVLRYELQLYKEEERECEKCGIKGVLIAHDALSDALVVKLLFSYLLELSSLEKMKELSLKNVLLEKFNFGKYKGKYIEEVFMKDRGYLKWMLENISDLDEDLKYSIDYHLKG